MDTINQQLQEKLEEIVDRTSLQLVLQALEQVCYEKHQHVLLNWQDKDLADAWYAAAKAVDKAISNTGVSGVSIAPPARQDAPEWRL